MWLFKHDLTDPAEGAGKERVTLTSSANFYYEITLRWYQAIDQFLLQLYVPNDNIAKIDAEVRSLRQGLMTVADYAQEMWRRPLIRGSVYDEKSLNALFVEGGTHPI